MTQKKSIVPTGTPFPNVRAIKKRGWRTLPPDWVKDHWSKVLRQALDEVQEQKKKLEDYRAKQERALSDAVQQTYEPFAVNYASQHISSDEEAQQQKEVLEDYRAKQEQALSDAVQQTYEPLAMNEVTQYISSDEEIKALGEYVTMPG